MKRPQLLTSNFLRRLVFALLMLVPTAALTQSDAWIAWDEGVKLYEENKFQLAANAFERALKEAPDDPAIIWTIQYWFGLTAVDQLENYTLAIEMLSNERDRSLPAAYWLARAHSAKPEPNRDEAIAAAKAAQNLLYHRSNQPSVPINSMMVERVLLEAESIKPKETPFDVNSALILVFLLAVTFVFAYVFWQLVLSDLLQNLPGQRKPQTLIAAMVLLVLLMGCLVTFGAHLMGVLEWDEAKQLFDILLDKLIVLVPSG